MQRKLQPPANNLSIHSHTGAPIEVNPLSITPPQVAEQIRAPTLEGRTLDQVHCDVSLAQFHVASRAV